MRLYKSTAFLNALAAVFGDNRDLVPFSKNAHGADARAFCDKNALRTA